VPLLDADDVVIDGGNSYYRDDITRSTALRANGLHYIDVGTSGGVWGLERGYCLMIGGDADAVQRLNPIFRTIAPGLGTRSRRRDAPPTPRLRGVPALRAVRCRALRQDGAQRDRVRHDGRDRRGLSIIESADIGLQENATHDAETTPLRDPEAYQYDINVADVAEVWRRGSVVSSWLVDLIAAALAKSPELAEFSGRVSDSGEGRWTVLAAVEEGVPAPVITTSLYDGSSRATWARSPGRSSRPCGRSSAARGEEVSTRSEQAGPARPSGTPRGTGTPGPTRT